MKVFEIRYMNYEGDINRTHVKVEDDENENDAEYKAFDVVNCWGAGIHQILSCEEVFDIDPNELE